MTTDDFVLGKHQATLDTLVSGQEDILRRLGEIEDILAERRGERRAATALWAAASGAIGALALFLAKAWLGLH